MKKTEYKSWQENYEQALTEAREMSVRDIKSDLRWRDSFHSWAVKALEQVLKEKENR